MLNEYELMALSENLKETGHEKDMAEVLSRCEALGVRILTPASRGFPKLLSELGDDCPKALYLLGKGSLEGPKTAVVGSRKATPYGVQAAEAIAEILGKGGQTVVSGMARGIDSYAHKGALASGAETIAVLGCGVDICYPPENEELCEEIMAHGLLISEYPPGEKPLSWHFPERNRIISGLCRETIVVEARTGSGSIITAKYAADQNRDVYVVPGSIFGGEDNEIQMLLEEGAIPLGRLSDVEKLCQLKVSPELVQKSLPEDIKWISDFISDFGTLPGEIEKRSGRPAGEILSALVRASSCGVLVKGRDGKWYRKCKLLS